MSGSRCASCFPSFCVSGQRLMGMGGHIALYRQVHYQPVSPLFLRLLSPPLPLARPALILTFAEQSHHARFLPPSRRRSRRQASRPSPMDAGKLWCQTRVSDQRWSDRLGQCEFLSGSSRVESTRV